MQRISELVESLLRSVQGSAVIEIEYEADGRRLRLVREPHAAPVAVVQPAAPCARPKTEPGAGISQLVRAPVYGTFYRSSAPGEPPIADVGQAVEVGQQLGLVEAMKMLHAVEAECPGRIVKVFAENGTAIEPGTPLFEIEMTGSGGV